MFARATIKPGQIETGTASISGSNCLYTPNHNYEGVDTFSFTVSDGVWTSSSPATVTIFVVAGPTNLTVECNTNGPGILLNWNLDDTVQEMEVYDGLAINGFEIYRSTVAGVFTTNDIIYTTSDATQTNYLDLGVVPGTTNYYAVDFINNEYNPPTYGQITYRSPFSNEVTNVACLPPPSGAMDVAFIIDNTGSMNDVIEAIQDGIDNTLDYIAAASGNDYRLALVTPDNDQVNVRVSFALTNRVAFVDALNDPSFPAPYPYGNNTPESTDECLNTVVNALVATGRVNTIDCVRQNSATPLQIGDFTPAFRTNAVKYVVLITDAPPSGFCDSDADPYDTSYETYAHTYALEAAANHIKINAILVTGGYFESDGRTVQQDYATTTCGWYPLELAYYSSSDDIEADILYMLYNAGECGSQ